MSIQKPLPFNEALSFKKQHSLLDDSVNFTASGSFPGLIEARYVRRCEAYFIVYLSSQTGCDKACRMCHLTQSGQTSGVQIPLSNYIAQATAVLDWYDESAPAAKTVHFNFMASGEVFANPYVLANGDALMEELSSLALSRKLLPRFKFSTIMPKEMDELEITDVFQKFTPDVYYSLYSTEDAFRRRWLPKALPVEAALGKLVRYQEATRKIPVLHWAFIEGENDSPETIESIAEAINRVGLRPDFNFVRYNPFSQNQGNEPPMETLEARALLLSSLIPGSRVKIVGRVGFDVKASCGMFVGGRAPLKRS